MYSKTCVKRPLSKRPKIGFQDQLSLNSSQKYCRMLQGEHSAIHLTFIKLPFAIKIFVLSFFAWPFYTGFTVLIHQTYRYFHPHSAIRLTFIQLPFVIKIFVLSIFEWPFYAGFTVLIH